jgi:hypothetical protein
MVTHEQVACDRSFLPPGRPGPCRGNPRYHGWQERSGGALAGNKNGHRRFPSVRPHAPLRQPDQKTAMPTVCRHELPLGRTGSGEDCYPSLKNKRASPHVLRHTTAMDLLQEGVEPSVIALWLGLESVETTQVYLDARCDAATKFPLAMPSALRSSTGSLPKANLPGHIHENAQARGQMATSRIIE